MLPTSTLNLVGSSYARALLVLLGLFVGCTSQNKGTWESGDTSGFAFDSDDDDDVEPGGTSSCTWADGWALCFEFEGYEDAEAWCARMSAEYSIPTFHAAAACTEGAVNSCSLPAGGDFEHACTAYYYEPWSSESAAEACVSAGGDPECSPRASTGCHQGNVFSYDSCGRAEEQIQECSEACWAGECVNSTCDVYLRFDDRTCKDVGQVFFGGSSSIWSNHTVGDCSDDDPDLCPMWGIHDFEPGEAMTLMCDVEFPSGQSCGTSSLSLFCEGADLIKNYECNDGS